MDPAGCPICFDDEPDALWQARPWSHVQDLVEESHFGISLCACGSCGQRFVKIFTEFIDWQDGDDPQHWDLLPLRPEEAEELARQGEAVSLQRLGQLGEGRRRLQVDYPKGMPRSVRFTSGAFFIMPGH